MTDSDSEASSSEAFRSLMEARLPKNIVLFLRASGFDTEESFLMFDESPKGNESLAQIEELLRKDSAVLMEDMKSEEAETMYGLYYKFPTSFRILPGHKTLILKFVKEVKELSQKKAQKVTEKSIAVWGKSSETAYLSSKISPNPLEGETLYNSIPDTSTVLHKLRGLVNTYLNSSREYRTLEEGEHFSIQVSPVSTATDEIAVCAAITCLVCGRTVHLPPNKTKSCFQPGNFYRHINSCILKKTRKNVVKKRLSKTSNSSKDNSLEFFSQPGVKQRKLGELTIVSVEGGDTDDEEEDNDDDEETTSQLSNKKSSFDHTYPGRKPYIVPIVTVSEQNMASSISEKSDNNTSDILKNVSVPGTTIIVSRATSSTTPKTTISGNNKIST